MQIKKVIRGKEYVFEVPYNHIVGSSIAQSYDGYKIELKTQAYSTCLYKVNTSYFLPKERKLIGTLVYDNEKDTLTLYKFVEIEKHKYNKSESFGVNNEIISRLRPRDMILISDGENNYTISVRKALTVGNYMQFEKYEKQLFIPISEFKVKGVKR